MTVRVNICESHTKKLFSFLLICLLKSTPCWLMFAKLHHWGHTKKGETPLHFATKTENFEVLKILLEFSKNKNPANNAGVTLLHLGAKQGNLAIFEYVWNLTLEKNPGNDSGFTPLHVACERGHLDIVKFLVSRLKG